MHFPLTDLTTAFQCDSIWQGKESVHVNTDDVAKVEIDEPLVKHKPINRSRCKNEKKKKGKREK